MTNEMRRKIKCSGIVVNEVFELLTTVLAPLSLTRICNICKEVNPKIN